MDFQIGDIVKDVTNDFGGDNFIGIIESAVIVYGKPVFHIRFFDCNELIPLHPYEIVKVS